MSKLIEQARSDAETLRENNRHYYADHIDELADYAEKLERAVRWLLASVEMNMVKGAYAADTAVETPEMRKVNRVLDEAMAEVRKLLEEGERDADT